MSVVVHGSVKLPEAREVGEQTVSESLSKIWTPVRSAQMIFSHLTAVETVGSTRPYSQTSRYAERAGIITPS